MQTYIAQKLPGFNYATYNVGELLNITGCD